MILWHLHYLRIYYMVPVRPRDLHGWRLTVCDSLSLALQTRLVNSVLDLRRIVVRGVDKGATNMALEAEFFLRASGLCSRFFNFI